LFKKKNEIIERVFPNLLNNYLDHNWHSSRAIWAAKNVNVDEISCQIQQLLSGDLMYFKSIDTIVDENKTINFPTYF